jgi:hypothetical protein
MYRARRYWENFNASDPVTQGIAVVALLLLAVFSLPYFNFPWQASGSQCTDMASPHISGNNQSLLSQMVDPSVLHLELVPPTVSISPGDTLKMSVRFINESMAPVTLYLTPDMGIFRYTDQESGVLFSIQSADGRVLGEPASVRAVSVGPQSYTQDQLRILRPRSRCTIDVSIDPNRLRAAQITAGQYQIIAVYRNQYKGIVPPPGTLTPTPIFSNLGVWTGQVRSNPIVLIVGAQPAVNPTR